MSLSILGLITLIFDLFSINTDAPLLLLISLKLANGETTPQDKGVIGTPAISIVLTAVFAVLALLPFLLSRYLRKTFTVNSTAKVSNWVFFISDCFIVLAISATLMAVLYLSASDEASIIIACVVHLMWGAATYALARFTWTASKNCQAAVL